MKHSMRVLFVASEIRPLAKTGGLADVSAALPAMLARMGVDVHLLMPGYEESLGLARDRQVIADLNGLAGIAGARLVAARTPDTGLPIWLIDCPSLFARPGGLYQDPNGVDWPDNGVRFATLSHAAARLASGGLMAGWRADIVHLNDWQAGLTAALLAASPGRRPATLFTIHNMAFQGIFPPEMFPTLRLPSAFNTADGLEYYGKLSFLKAGIRFSNRLTTVSPTYAREILAPDYGFGLDGLLRQRSRDLTGILNGVDYEVWDPQQDHHLPARYSSTDLSGKRRCKTLLQRELGLAEDPDIPLVAFTNRVTHQKMADVVFQALPRLLDLGVQFALQGRGEGALEQAFATFARDCAGRIAVRIGFEEGLDHRLNAGADLSLCPARFEPCGLTPLYAMRYGTLPVVRPVGGLADTVVDAGLARIADGKATGFVFDGLSSDDLVRCLDRALSVFRRPSLWRRVQLSAMEKRFGWQESAWQYLSLYRGLVGEMQPSVVARCPERETNVFPLPRGRTTKSLPSPIPASARWDGSGLGRRPPRSEFLEPRRKHEGD